MATYNREGRFTPVNIDSNPASYLQYAQQRMELQAKGESIVRSQYQNSLNLELSHSSNQDKLNGFFKGAQEKVNKAISQSNLDDFENVEKAMNIFDPLSTDEYKSVMLDNAYTKHYKEQLGIASSFKKRQDKDGSIGSGYSDYNYKELVNNYSKFKEASGQDYNAWGDRYTYKPYYDYTEEQNKRVMEFMKLPDKHSMDSMDANGVVTSITYEGKSASQIQKYLNATLTSKAKDQMLLEGRVTVPTDQEYIPFMRQVKEQTVRDIKDQIARLKITRQDKTNKVYTQEELKQQIKNLETDLPTYEADLAKLNDPNEILKLKRDKEGTYSNYYMNKKLASFSESMDNSRVSSELSSNSAFVSALNRNADLWKFTQKFHQDQQQFDANLDWKNRSLTNARIIAGMKEGFNDQDGNPLAQNSSPNSSFTNAPITNEDQQVVREQQEKELEGGISNVLQTVAPYIKDAFGISPSTSLNDAQESVAKVADLSNKLQSGDEKLLGLLNSSAADEKNYTPQQIATKRILTTLNDNDLKIVTYQSYQKQKKEAITKGTQGILTEIKKSGITLDQINNALLDKWWSSKGEIDKPFTTIESAAQALATNPALAEEFAYEAQSRQGNSALMSPTGYDRGNYTTETRNFGNIAKIGIATQNDINTHLNSSYFLNKKVSHDMKPIDDKTPGSKQQISSFNNRLNQLVPHIANQGTPEDFNADNVIGIDRDENGVKITYRPTVIEKGEIKLKEDVIQTIEIKNPSLGFNAVDQTNKILIGVMALDPNGETPYRMAKAAIPFKYKVATASGTKYSEEGGFRGIVNINGQPIAIPKVFVNPSDAEDFIKIASDNTANSIFKTINFELDKQNKKPLTKEEFSVILKSGQYKKLYDDKLQQVLKDEVFNSFGVDNPNNTDFENRALNNR